MSASKYKGHIAILTANIIWGLNSPISKTVLNSGDISPFALTTFRMVGAAAAFWLVSLFTKRENVPPKDLAMLFFAALCGIVFNQGVFIFGLSMTSPIDASIVSTTAPIITMIIAAFYLKEPITNKKVSGIFLGAVGALMLIISGQSTNVSSGENKIAGDLLCLFAQASVATYFVIFKDLISRYSPITLMKWMFMYTSMCYIPFSYHDIATIQYEELPVSLYSEIAFVVLAATFLSYMFIPIAQKTLRPTVISMYNYVQPIVASLIAIIVGLDTFTLVKAIAITLVFVGVYVVTQSKSKAQMDAEKIQKEKERESI